MAATGYEMNLEWNDSQSPALSARAGATAPPFAAMNGGIFGVSFRTNDEIHGSIQLPHSALTGGSELRMHVHFTFAAAAAPVVGETVIWALEWDMAGVNGLFGATDTRTGTYIIAANAANRHLVQAIHTVIMPSPAQSAILRFRLYRSGGTSIVVPFLLSVDGHFQQASMGTTAEYPV